MFSRKTLYLQVWDALAERITNGAWKPGTAIPNESNLAREFGVSVGTMRKALELLEARHLVTRRPGRGTFVNDQAVHLGERFSNLRTADGERICDQARSVEIAEGMADVLECTRLRLRAGETVYRIHRLREHRGRVLMVEDITMPAALFPGLAAKQVIADHVGALAQAYGILLGNTEERISVGKPPAAITNALRIAPGTPVLVLDRVVRILDCSRPVEWRLAHCHPADTFYVARTG